MSVNVNEILTSMSVEEKVGQLFLAHCPDRDEERVIKELHVGGFVMFARDFESYTPDGVRERIAKFQSWAKIPLALSADEEGGSVTRISKFPQFRDKPFESPHDMYRKEGLGGIRKEAKEKAELMKSLGLNYNLAPVCDYSVDPDSYISKRVLGVSPQVTAEFVRIVTKKFNELNVGVSLKHFPGYGGNTDTHKGMSSDSRPLSIFESEDLLPFIAGIQAGADSVMVSHNIVKCFDEEYPSSLSYPVHEYLRKKLGFNGVIITDSLTMSAIREFTNGSDPCTRALLCGNDMIITSKYEDGYHALLENVNNGTVSMDILDSAVLRILKMKARLGIIR